MQEFDKIYAQYFSYVYKFALTLCGDRHTAEEVTQETFFKALKNIDKFNGQSKISSWLCQIAKNTYLDMVRKNNRQADRTIEMISIEDPVEKAVSDRQTVYEIHKILHRLKEPYKEVFSLRTFGDLSFAQIGALFDKSETWARVTYYRAKTMIKENLK